MGVLGYAQNKLYAKEKEAETQLLVVEGDSNVADLQGFCAGVGVIKLALSERGLSVASDEDVELPAVDELDELLIQTMSMEITEVEESREWQDVKDTLKTEIEQKKDFLYETAKKGRDLAYVQGWKKAVEFIDKTFDLIQARAEELRQQPTLEF